MVLSVSILLAHQSVKAAVAEEVVGHCPLLLRPLCPAQSLALQAAVAERPKRLQQRGQCSRMSLEMLQNLKFFLQALTEIALE